MGSPCGPSWLSLWGKGCLCRPSRCIDGEDVAEEGDGGGGDAEGSAVEEGAAGVGEREKTESFGSESKISTGMFLDESTEKAKFSFGSP